MSKAKFVEDLNRLFGDLVLSEADFSAEGFEYFLNLKENRGGNGMKRELSEKAVAVLAVLEGASEPMLGKDIAKAAEIASSSISGVMTGLVRRGLVEKTEDSPRRYSAVASEVEVEVAE